MSARFAPVEIAADITSLPAGERQALAKLVEAAASDGCALPAPGLGGQRIAASWSCSSVDGAGGAGPTRLLPDQQGAWSRLDHNQPFVAGVPEKPGAANFYPAGATKAEIEQWVATLPPAEKERAIGFFTTIRRTPPGSAQPFAIVPYSLEYQGELARAASLLREAAAVTADASLKRFLEIARQRVSLQRLLRERCRLDGARFHHRTHDRSVRGVRGRVVQLEGRVRSVHHGERRGRI